jgi:hypothetical protein
MNSEVAGYAKEMNLRVFFEDFVGRSNRTKTFLNTEIGVTECALTKAPQSFGRVRTFGVRPPSISTS